MINSIAIGAEAKGNVQNGVALGSFSHADRGSLVDGYVPNHQEWTDYLSDADRSAYESYVKDMATRRAEITGINAKIAEATTRLGGESDPTKRNELQATIHQLRSEQQSKIVEYNGIGKKRNRIMSTWRSSLGAISVGDAQEGWSRQITNVSAGSEDTDAVNVAQLKAVESLITTNVNDNMEGLHQDITNLGDSLRDLHGESRSGIAMGAALSSLKPLDYKKEEPTQIMAGFGRFEGKSALALGIAHYSSESTLWNLGLGFSGKYRLYNGGATFRIGSSSSKDTTSPATVAVLIDELEQARQELRTYQAESTQKIEELERKIQFLMESKEK